MSNSNDSIDQLYLSKLNIEHFRKMDEMNFRFSPAVNMIVGHNGTGKSNLLALISSGTGIGRTENAPSYSDFFSISSEERFDDYKAHNIYETIESKQIFDRRLSFKKDNELNRAAHIVPRAQKSSEMGDIKSADSSQRLEEYFSRKVSHDSRMPIPTKYISVSRLIPRGETHTSSSVIRKASTETTNKYRKWYNEVIPNSIDNENTELLNVKKEAEKSKLEMHLIDAPIQSISVGQDSLNSIISSLVKLSDLKYSADNYKGSILVIDEFDMSLHADAQIRLLDLLIDVSTQYNIQIFLTTHSISAIKYFSAKVQKDANKFSMNYIKDRLTPMISKKNDFNSIANYLYVSSGFSLPKTSIYVEDQSSKMLLENILIDNPVFNMNTYNINIIATVTGKKTLQNLYDYDTHFKEHSMIILDGDARYSEKNADIKNVTTHDYIIGKKTASLPTFVGSFNKLILPSGFSPEGFIFNIAYFLINNTNNDTRIFWRWVNSTDSRWSRNLAEKELNINIDNINNDKLKHHDLKNKLFNFISETKLMEFLIMNKSELENKKLIDYSADLIELIHAIENGLKILEKRKTTSPFTM